MDLRWILLFSYPHFLVYVVENRFGGVEGAFYDLGVASFGALVQPFEQQWVFCQSLEHCGQQVLQLESATGFVRFRLVQSAVQVLVLLAALFEHFEGDLLAGAEAGGVFLQQLTGWAVELVARGGFRRKLTG